MESRQRAQLATRVLAGYPNGPNAPIEATTIALEKAIAAQAIILVEGISDQIAVDTLASRLGRDLDAEDIAVVPVGGAQAVMKFMRAFGPPGDNLFMAGLYDADAADTVRVSLTKAGVGKPGNESDMAALGFHVCVKDLEDELIRAVSPERVVDVVESQGELRAFRTFQRQPEWRGESAADQLHRSIGSKARRSLRYARLLVEVMDLDHAPRPLVSVLADV